MHKKREKLSDRKKYREHKSNPVRRTTKRKELQLICSKRLNHKRRGEASAALRSLAASPDERKRNPIRKSTTVNKHTATRRSAALTLVIETLLDRDRIGTKIGSEHRTEAVKVKRAHAECEERSLAKVTLTLREKRHCGRLCDASSEST